MQLYALPSEFRTISTLPHAFSESVIRAQAAWHFTLHRSSMAPNVQLDVPIYDFFIINT
ncbi:hypothetical protein AB0I52_02455 [Streptomyces sp. NPDC050423]|uniref:hypothetical protein n=1 Tax=Streptomyces sp. NPDC050423 TaxID=3155402 RepID=UPI0034123DAE